MDDWRSLNETALERDLALALRVGHSPEFPARVRIRIASEAKAPSIAFKRFALPAATLGVVLIVAGVAIWHPPLTEPLPARAFYSAAALKAPVVVPDAVSASADVQLSSGSAQADVRADMGPRPDDATPEIIVARDEIEAMVVLARHVHEGRVVLLMPPSPLSGDYSVGVADIPPITINPLPRLAPLQEERQ